MQNIKLSLGLLIQEGEQLLNVVGIEDSKREAQLLIASALRMSMTEIFMMDKQTPVDPTLVREYFARRAKREPFAYIVKEQGFWSLDLEVSSATLIPRADTESLIEVLLALLPDRQKSYRFLDLGTGTGCLLLAALSEYPNAFGIGIDRVEQAVHLARHNAVRCHMENRTGFITGYWGDSVTGKFDVILSNPPYIRQDEINNLMPEVKNYEPLSALCGGDKGLDDYIYICKQAKNLLDDRGILIFELGIEQDKEVSIIAQEHGLYVVEKQHDLNGCIRALVLSLVKL